MRNLKLSPEEYADTLWDWTKLNNAFDRGIRVGDVDGFVEVNNHFLFIEGKPINVKKLKRGQGLALRRLSEQPKMTVIIIAGNPPDQIEKWWVRGEFSHELEVNGYDGNYDDFIGFVRLWFEWADNKRN